MQITVKTFAQTREITGEDNIALNLSDSSTIEAVISQLKTRSDKWTLALEGSVLTARNQELCDTDTVLSDGDELAHQEALADEEVHQAGRRSRQTGQCRAAPGS